MVGNEKESEDKPISENLSDSTVLSRLRSKSLPILHQPDGNQCLEYEDLKVALEDTNIQLPSERTLTSQSHDNVGNLYESKRQKKSGTSRICKQRLQKGIVVGKLPGGYPYPTKPLREISRKHTELAIFEDVNGDQFETLVVAPDGYIPNSVVAALFADMRPKEVVFEKEPEEIIPWKPPQLTDAQLEELKRMETVSTLSTKANLCEMVRWLVG